MVAMTVLILDDDAAVRESLMAFFEDREWQVLSAPTGEDALQIVKNNQIDCVIVDIRLPGMDGNAFIMKLNITHPELACIVCTGSPEYDSPDEVKALLQVSRTVFIKPVINMKLLEDDIYSQIEKCKK
ncbi:response regulator [bacterium]|nr:response regulator [bacterium]